MISGSIPGCDDFFFWHSTILDRLRFALRAHGLRRLLRRANFISAPCGWEQGVKWDHIRVGSGPGGIRPEGGACYGERHTRFAISVIVGGLVFVFPRILMGNIPRTFKIYNMEDPTGTRRASHPNFVFFVVLRIFLGIQHLFVTTART